MIFLIKYWRYIAGAVLLAVVAMSFLTYRHSLIKQGRAEIQLLWDKDEAEERLLVEQANARERQREAASAERNAKIEADYANQILTTLADRDRVYRLLQRARATDAAILAGQNPDIGGTAETAQSGRAEEINAAIADTLIEKSLNDARYSALLKQLEGQVTVEAHSGHVHR